jgi:hypothetical protein
LTDGLPITKNSDLFKLSEYVEIQTFGSGNSLVRITILLNEYGQEIRLDSATEDRLEVILNDDLQGLAEHYFKVDGYIENRPY